MRKIIQIILGGIGCLFLMFTGNAQTKSTKKYQYCYCPKANSIVPVKTNSAVTFRVSRFHQEDITQIEFEITKTDTSDFIQPKVRFTAKARFPWGRPISNDLLVEDKRISLKNVSRLFIGNEKSVEVFVQVTGKQHPPAVAGPITVYRELKDTPGFEAHCEKLCPVRQPGVASTRGWSFNPPATMIISRTGEKNDVVGSELLTLGMLPTEGMMAMMDKLNYTIYLKKIIPAGTTCVLPKFPKIEDQQQKDLLQQFETDNAVDPVQNAVFLERSKSLVRILKSLALPAKNEALKKDVSEIDELLTNMTERTQATLKKNQTDIINSEVENFSNFLTGDFSRGNPTNAGINYIHNFKNYLFQVVQPGLPEKSKTTIRTSGAASQATNYFSAYLEQHRTAAAPDFKVYIYAFENEHSAPLKKYFIYCITQFQYDQLLKKQKITIEDLNKITTRCQDPASASAKLLNPSFPYYFIAVSTDTKEIRMCNKVDLKTLSKTSESKFIDKPYAVSLYPIDKCF